MVEDFGLAENLMIAVAIEASGGGGFAPYDQATLEWDADGHLVLYAPSHNHGQGHETVYAQMVTEWLGVDFHSIRMIQGDTDQVGFGRIVVTRAGEGQGTATDTALQVWLVWHASHHQQTGDAKVAEGLQERRIDDTRGL